MILKVFAVRDMKAMAFLQPYFSNATMSAIRAFGDACVEEKTVFNRHPEDYVLYEIGTYDDNTGELCSLAPVKMLGCAADFVVAAGRGVKKEYMEAPLTAGADKDVALSEFVHVNGEK